MEQGTVRFVEGYGAHSYGDAFADVYDDWYADLSDVADTVRALVALADGGPVLELGVGTGRIALPMALADPALEVTGIDASEAMLARLAERDPFGAVRTILGDMVNDVPAGPFGLVVVAYNTLFNLTTAEAQQACFGAIAERLRPGGRFVVEGFVPDDPPRSGDDIAVRSISADRVVLAITRHDADAQAACGQFVELTQLGGVRMRPWSIRYATPSQLDSMAEAAGLVLEQRHERFDGTPFTPDSTRHVSVYRRSSAS